MAPGETGELFDELSEERCPLCGELEGAEKHRCKSNRKKLEGEGWVFGSAEDFLNDADQTPIYEVGNPVPVATVCDPGDNFNRDTDTAGVSGAICICGTWVPYGQEHDCIYNPPNIYNPPKTINVSTDGYTCVFCNKWINSGSMHLCLYENQKADLDYAEILDRLKEVKDGIHYLLQEIRKVQNGL